MVAVRGQDGSMTAQWSPNIRSCATHGKAVKDKSRAVLWAGIYASMVKCSLMKTEAKEDGGGPINGNESLRFRPLPRLIEHGRIVISLQDHFLPSINYCISIH